MYVYIEEYATVSDDLAHLHSFAKDLIDLDDKSDVFINMSIQKKKEFMEEKEFEMPAGIRMSSGGTVPPEIKEAIFNKLEDLNRTVDNTKNTDSYLLDSTKVRVKFVSLLIKEREKQLTSIKKKLKTQGVNID